VPKTDRTGLKTAFSNVFGKGKLGINKAP